ncbi:MAG: hypothetical protein ACTSPB_23120, partial [Candidatus Thorarchaeota archaeon]
KVIVIGVDENGNEVIGTAGTGTNVVVIRERKAIDQDTAQALASKYYEELSKESSGAQLPASITDAYDLFPGDTVTLENSLLGYSGVYRILKTTKRLDRVTIELDRASAILEQLIERTERFEDLGIYPISRQQMPATMPSGTSFPSNPRAGDLFYRTDEDRVYRYNGTSWVKIVVTTGEGTSFPANPRTGDLFYRTDENTLYRFDGSNWKAVHALSQHGDSLPSDGRVGDFFFNTTENALYRYNGSQWVEVLRITQSGASLPASGRFVGDLFYSTNYEQTFYWTGSAWVPLATIARAGTSFPSDVVAGDVFFRTDELKFYRYDGSNWVVVHPEILSSPAEEYLPNSAFEIDRDGDDIPDHWSTQTLSGSPSFGRDTVSEKGGYCAKIVLTAAGEGKYKSVFLLIEGGKKYLVSCKFKGSAGKTHEWSVLLLEVFDKNKSYDNDKWNEIDPPAEWKTTTTNFGLHEWLVEIPSSMTAKDGVTTFSPRYVRVVLRNYGSSTTYETVYWDDVVFSELRAAEPTAGIVAAAASQTMGSAVTCSPNTWTTVRSLTVPNEEHEILFVYCVTNASVQAKFRYRIKNVTKNEYYPSSTTTECPISATIPDYGIVALFMTVPKNVGGDTLELQIYNLESTDRDFGASISCWGHSPHYHR